MEGFILTKWYVNTEPTSIVGLKSTSFILTKWYVNSFSNCIVGYTYYKFYIN
ncbi:hypothetical protein QC3_1700 [Clostridioides difficile CD22]|nr:hypothetical protein QC3_1700 [Clostridioides difficile CD22]